MKTTLLLALLAFSSILFGRTIPSVQLLDLPASSWVEFLEVETGATFSYEPSIVEGVTISFDSNGAIESERLKRAFLLLLELRSIIHEENDGEITLEVKSSTPLDRRLLESTSDRLPEGWVRHSDEKIESISIDGAPAFLALETLREVSGRIVLSAENAAPTDTITIDVKDATREKVARAIVSSLETFGYRFLLIDDFLVMKKIQNQSAHTTPAIAPR